MRKAVVLAAVAVLTAVSFVSGEKPADKPSAAPSVERLIEQLGDEDYRKRDAALKELTERGPDVLPALRKAVNHPEPEVRRRLEALIPALETAQALTPKQVTLAVEKKTVKEILDELAKQTGYKMQHWGGGEQDVFSFQFDKVPFWKAVDRVAEAAGLVLQTGYGDDQLRFSRQDAVVPHVCYDGPFRVTATGFQYYRTINFGTVPKNATPPKGSESLTLSFTVFCEPRLPLLGVGQATVVKAYDENNAAMEPPNGDGQANPGGRRSYYYGGGYRMYSQPASLPLVRPSEKSRSVKYLKATVPVTLLTEQKPVVVAEPVLTAKGTKTKIGNLTFLVHEVKENPGPQFQVKMSVSNEDGNDPGWTNSLYNRFELRDEKDNRYQSNGSSWGGGGNAVEMTLHYTPPANVKADPPRKLIFHQWTTMEHQITLEFKDLPLP